MSTPARTFGASVAAPGIQVKLVRPRFTGLQMLVEIVREAAQGLSRNRFRAVLSMIGISWGIVSVVMLLAYGNGFRDALARGFANAFGEGVNVAWPGQTSSQAGGERAGRRIRVKIDDVHQMAMLPLVKNISPELVEELPVSFGTKQTSYLIRAVAPSYGIMRSERPLPGGRFIDDEDVRLQRRVAFLGSEVNRKLFGESDAIGQTIRIRGLSFEIVGVMQEKAQLSNYFRPDAECIFVAYTVADQLWYQSYVDTFVWQAVSVSLEPKADQSIREYLAKQYSFNPTDERALRNFGSSETAKITGGMVLGLKLVLGFIGVLTLGIGGVGVMNIMFVSVQERTREIGIRKAVGAKRRHVLLQFLLEGVATSIMGGVVGILISLALVWGFSPRPFLAELLDDTTRASDIFLVLSFDLVATCSLILMVVGLIAGLLPAIRASRLDPIEALRYE